MTQAGNLDAFDQKILSALAADGRLSWRELAEKIGLSLSPTIRRVRRLEELGIIKGYYAAIDQGRLHAAIGVFITVALERQVKNALVEFESRVRSIPEVVGGYQISGGSDYLIHAMVEDLPHFQTLLDSLTAIDGVSRIQSNFVVKTFIQRQAPLQG
jgi:DNA-binding Lrp family transcriptional regulator